MPFEVDPSAFFDLTDADDKLVVDRAAIEWIVGFVELDVIFAVNRPRLMISPTCRNTINGIEKWSRDPKTLKPKEEYKDFADVVRYLLMAEPRYEPENSWPTGISGPNYTVIT